jgi:predicted ATPase
MLTAIADVLSLTLSGQNELRRQLLHCFHDKTLLLVLDNFDQVLTEAGFLGELLQHGSAITLLVTSRVALHLQEECLYPVAGLVYPATDQAALDWNEIEHFDVVQLFVEQARRVQPGFPPARNRLACCACAS